MRLWRARECHNMNSNIQVQSHTISPKLSLPFLGIQLDPKLSWAPHIKRLQAKADLQMQTLSRSTQSTWGANFKKTRLLYYSVVRPALTYGSPIWAKTRPAGKIPERILEPLRSAQRKFLKLTTGAYQLTSSRMLEHETSTLPIEIYLRQRRTQYTGISDNLPVQQAIVTACKIIMSPNEGRINKRGQNRTDNIIEWTKICRNIESKGGQKVARKNAAYEEWAESWTIKEKGRRLGYRAQADPDIWKAANLLDNKKAGRLMMNYRESPIQIHQNLSRAQSSIATQVRSTHIELNAYLYWRNVPGVVKPQS